MSSVNVTGDQRIKEAFARLNEAAQRGVIAKTAQDVFDYAQHQADRHTKTGALFRSTYIKPISGGWEIGQDERIAPHAKFVHLGTRPHMIKPKDKNALRWVKFSRFFFAKQVHHPGYVGHPWLVEARDRVLPEKFRFHLQQAIDAL